MSSRMMRLVAGALVAVIVCPTRSWAVPGGGGGQGSGGRSGDVLTATVAYETPETRSSAVCTWTLVDGEFGVLTGATLVTYPSVRDGTVYHAWRRDCPDGAAVFEVPERTPEDLVPELLTQLRERTLPKPVPTFEALDAQFGWAYVRTPVDFRAGGAWRPVSVTASVGPIWATVTAVPQRLTFDPGDPASPTPVVCAGAGPVAPYDASRPGVCSYTYRNASSTSPVDGYHFRTRLTIEWAITWTSSTGAGGVLEPYATSSEALLAVAEVKGLVTCTGPRPQQGGC